MYKWFEIFRTGKHTDSAGRTREWTEEDLDKIAGAYDPAKHEAPIVIGHPENDSPAYGWIQALKRSGDRLLALPSKMLPAFIEAVKNGLFKKRSVALHADNTLKHVGFLGAALPAVKGLADVQFAEEEGEIVYTSPIAFSALQQNIDELTKAKSNIEELLKAEGEKTKQLENDLQELKKKNSYAEFDSFLNAKLEEGIITPAQKVELHHLGNLLYAEAGIEPLMKFVSAMPKQIEFGEIALKAEPQKSASDRMADEIRKRNPQSY